MMKIAMLFITIIMHATLIYSFSKPQTFATKEEKKNKLEKNASILFHEGLKGSSSAIASLLNIFKTFGDELTAEYIITLTINHYETVNKIIREEGYSNDNFKELYRAGVSEYSKYNSRFELIKFIYKNEEEIMKDSFFREIFTKQTLGYVESSSYLNKEARYEPFNIYDGDTSTVWVEGKKESGIGEEITIYLQSYWPEKNVYKGIKIYNGYFKDKNIFYKNNRLKKAKVELSDGQIKIVEFEDIMEPKTINFEQSTIQWARITILEVYRGTKKNNTCISEVQFIY